MTTPGVSHPSATTVENFRRILDERAVAGDPARLPAAVAQARGAGWGVALDGVGAAPASLAVLPFVRPDVIKLDMRPLQGRTTAEAGHIINTVRAQAERTDAVVIAEGIETIRHAREAVATGATVGQGSCSGTRRLVIGPRFAAVLAAKDLGDDGPDLVPGR